MTKGSSRDFSGIPKIPQAPRIHWGFLRIPCDLQKSPEASRSQEIPWGSLGTARNLPGSPQDLPGTPGNPQGWHQDHLCTHRIPQGFPRSHLDPSGASRRSPGILGHHPRRLLSTILLPPQKQARKGKHGTRGGEPGHPTQFSVPHLVLPDPLLPHIHMYMYVYIHICLFAS